MKMMQSKVQGRVQARTQARPSVERIFPTRRDLRSKAEAAKWEDGLTDWEEYQLGLDPFSGASNNQLDGNGQPLGDYAFAAGRLGNYTIGENGEVILGPAVIVTPENVEKFKF